MYRFGPNSESYSQDTDIVELMAAYPHPFGQSNTKDQKRFIRWGTTHDAELWKTLEERYSSKWGIVVEAFGSALPF